jgi:hypothetical protein
MKVRRYDRQVRGNRASLGGAWTPTAGADYEGGTMYVAGRVAHYERVGTTVTMHVGHRMLLREKRAQRALEVAGFQRSDSEKSVTFDGPAMYRLFSLMAGSQRPQRILAQQLAPAFIQAYDLREKPRLYLDVRGRGCFRLDRVALRAVRTHLEHDRRAGSRRVHR